MLPMFRAAVVLTALAGLAGAQGTEKNTKESFAIVQIGDERKILPTAEVDAEKKKAKTDHAKSLRDWTEARKAAKKAKQPFEEPRPKPTAFRVLAASLPSEEAARKKLDALSAKAVKAGGGFAVVSVGDETKVIEAKELRDLKKRVAADHKRAMEQYAARKRAATKRKEKFEEKPPKRPAVRVVKTGIATEDEAKKIADATGAAGDAPAGRKPRKRGKRG